MTTSPLAALYSRWWRPACWRCWPPIIVDLILGLEALGGMLAGDTVGDPFKGASGPFMNISMKLMAIVSLVVGPALVR